MRYSCKYNPDLDIMATVPDMSIDLAGAIESGVVLDTGMIAEHNDIDSPASIIGRVHDAFDAIEAHRAIMAAARAAVKVETPIANNASGANSAPAE